MLSTCATPMVFKHSLTYARDLFKRKEGGWRFRSVAEHLPNKLKTLGFLFSTRGKKRQNENKGGKLDIQFSCKALTWQAEGPELSHQLH